jgi:hypothetical protein
LKPIKFNLIVEGYPARNLEDLKAHFNIDDIFYHFKNKTLQRWLEVRNFIAEAQQIANLKDLSNFEIAKYLMQIFLGEINEKSIKHFIIYEENNNRLLKINNQKLNSNQIIYDYHQRYEILKEILANEKYNRIIINEAIYQLEDEFFQLFKLEARELLIYYLKNNILVLISILLSKKLRIFPLEYREIKSKLSYIIAIRDEYIRDIYNNLKNINSYENNIKDRIRTFQGDTDQKWIKLENREVLILQSNAGTKLKDNFDDEVEVSHVYAKGLIMRGLKFQSFKENNFVKYIPLDEIGGFISAINIFRGETGGYWKDLESADKSCLILKLGDGCFIRSIGKIGEELNSENINGEFILLNGIDYKSNSENEPLYYITTV